MSLSHHVTDHEYQPKSNKFSYIFSWSLHSSNNLIILTMIHTVSTKIISENFSIELFSQVDASQKQTFISMLKIECIMTLSASLREKKSYSHYLLFQTNLRCEFTILVIIDPSIYMCFFIFLLTVRFDTFVPIIIILASISYSHKRGSKSIVYLTDSHFPLFKKCL